MIVLDASMALAWHFKRTDPQEALLAQRALQSVIQDGALVPGLWYSEVTNGLLYAEKHGVTTPGAVAAFHADLTQLGIQLDSALPDATMALVLSLGRLWKVTASDATYLELALRSGSMLATFDPHLAAAVRSAGGRVFGNAK
jgi:predicted nucleic acid-binding protein